MFFFSCFCYSQVLSPFIRYVHVLLPSSVRQFATFLYIFFAYIYTSLINKYLIYLSFFFAAFFIPLFVYTRLVYCLCFSFLFRFSLPFILPQAICFHLPSPVISKVSILLCHLLLLFSAFGIFMVFILCFPFFFADELPVFRRVHRRS